MKINCSLIILCLIFTLINSCSNDDSNDSGNIEGTYVLSEFRFNDNYDFNRDGTESENVLDEIICNSGDQIILNSDNSGMIIGDSENLDFVQIFESTDASGQIEIEYFYIAECIESSPSEIAFTWEETSDNQITITTLLSETFTFQLRNNSLINIQDNAIRFEEIVAGELTGEVIEEDITLVYTKR